MLKSKTAINGIRPILIVMILVLFISCHRKSASDHFSIEGKVTNGAGRKIILSEMGINDVIPLDSVNTDPEGKFSLSCEMKEPGFYLLTFSNVKIILVPQAGEKMLLQADLSRPSRTYEVSGSEDTRLLRKFLVESAVNMTRIDSVKEVLLQHEDHEDFYVVSMQADSAFQKISHDQTRLEKQFIDAHPHSLASLIVLSYSLGGGPVLDEEEYFGYYKKLDSTLTKTYPSNKHVLYHHRRVEEMKDRNEAMKGMGKSRKK